MPKVLIVQPVPENLMVAIRQLRAAQVLATGEAASVADNRALLFGLESTDAIEVLDEDNLELVQRFVQLLADGGINTEIVPSETVEAPPMASPEEVFAREENPEQPQPHSYLACQLAIVCMALGDGVPNKALQTANTFEYVLEEHTDIFQAAANVLLDTFRTEEQVAVPADLIERLRRQNGESND